MAKAIGIDLGTTNSVAAFKEAGVEVVTHSENKPPDYKLTPSAVAEINGKVCVGLEALNALKDQPSDVIVSIKRLMGRGFLDDRVQSMKSKSSYKIDRSTKGTENSLSVWMGGKEYEPEDISAFILKKVVENAIKYRQEQLGKTGESITQAVITIPAYFNDKQKQATRTAAYRAGLTPIELLPEPTAAAISYGFSPDSSDVKTILVYDFGGGTFDASLITATGTEFIELGKAGDLWLGGDNIDEELINFVKNQVKQEEGIDNIDALIERMPDKQRNQLKAELKVACERAKIELSQFTEAMVQPTAQLVDEDGYLVPISVTIARQVFEGMISNLVDRTIQICHEALRISEYTIDLVDVVLLVGGSSQIPLVQEKMKQAFGAEKIVVHPHPMYAVAEGAAIVAAKKVNKVGTVSRDYCIRLADGSFTTEIAQGEVLPILKSRVYKTVSDSQHLVHFEFFSPDRVAESLEGETKHERIGDLWLPLEGKLKKGTEIVVFYELDEKETELKVSAHLKNDSSVRVQTTFSRGRSDEIIYKSIEEFINEINENSFLSEVGVEALANDLIPILKRAGSIIDPNTGRENKDVYNLTEAEFKRVKVRFSPSFVMLGDLMTELDFILRLGSDLLPETYKVRLKSLKRDIDNALASGAESEIDGIYERAKREIGLLPEPVLLLLALKHEISVVAQGHPEHKEFLWLHFSELISGMEHHDRLRIESAFKEIDRVLSQYTSDNLSAAKLITGISL
jgi:molecular chaperone DnaK